MELLLIMCMYVCIIFISYIFIFYSYIGYNFTLGHKLLTKKNNNYLRTQQGTNIKDLAQIVYDLIGNME